MEMEECIYKLNSQEGGRWVINLLLLSSQHILQCILCEKQEYFFHHVSIQVSLPPNWTQTATAILTVGCSLSAIQEPLNWNLYSNALLMKLIGLSLILTASFSIITEQKH